MGVTEHTYAWYNSLRYGNGWHIEHSNSHQYPCWLVMRFLVIHHIAPTLEAACAWVARNVEGANGQVPQV